MRHDYPIVALILAVILMAFESSEKEAVDATDAASIGNISNRNDENAGKTDVSSIESNQNSREEVIPESTVDSLPTGPDDEPTLTDAFATTQSFFEVGNPNRLVVFSADWCGLCQTYKQNMTGFNVAESFDAEIQIVDYDKHPALAKLFSVTSLPTTIYKGGRASGAMPRGWLESKMGTIVPKPSAHTEAVDPESANVPQAVFSSTPQPVQPRVRYYMPKKYGRSKTR